MERLVQGRHDLAEQRVAGSVVDRQMEFPVLLRCRTVSPMDRLHAFQLCLNPGDLGVAGLDGNQRRRLGLQCPANVQGAQQAVTLPLDRQRKMDRVAIHRRAQICAAAFAHVDHAKRFPAFQGFADGRPTHLQPLGQLPLRR